ncbi:MAG TPA: SMR family transporter [Ilumatobacteraceae bacterium]|jgi:multidrug transporter EmrE-like cation transporter|nr:SMR family transporter [Ilumatobacteraceae bacterium]
MATIIIGSVAFSIGGAFMRLSEGFTRLWPSVIVATCFVVGAGFLAKAVNRGGLSTTYVIGLGLEALISVGIGLALLGERLTVSQTAGVAIILVGLATLKHG